MAALLKGAAASAVNKGGIIFYLVLGFGVIMPGTELNIVPGNVP